MKGVTLGAHVDAGYEHACASQRISVRILYSLARDRLNVMHFLVVSNRISSYGSIIGHQVSYICQLTTMSKSSKF